MYKFNWKGNGGQCFPNPGEVKKAKCGICGARMNVERNVHGPTGFAEAMGGLAHLHDEFNCPHLMESWHMRIVVLKYEAYARCYFLNNKEETEEIVEALEKKIKKILMEAEKQR